MRSNSETVREQAAGVFKSGNWGQPSAQLRTFASKSPNSKSSDPSAVRSHPHPSGLATYVAASQLAPFATGASNSESLCEVSRKSHNSAGLLYLYNWLSPDCGVSLPKLIPAIGYGGAPPGHRHSVYESCSIFGRYPLCACNCFSNMRCQFHPRCAAFIEAGRFRAGPRCERAKHFERRKSRRLRRENGGHGEGQTCRKSLAGEVGRLGKSRAYFRK